MISVEDFREITEKMALCIELADAIATMEGREKSASERLAVGQVMRKMSEKMTAESMEILKAGMPLAEVMLGGGLATSKGEVKRLLCQNAVSIDHRTENDPDFLVFTGQCVRVGKRRSFTLGE